MTAARRFKRFSTKHLDALQQDAQYWVDSFIRNEPDTADSDLVKVLRATVDLVQYAGSLVAENAELKRALYGKPAPAVMVDTDTERHLTLMRYLSADMMDGSFEDGD